jgi:hypothetical protein
MRRGNLRLSSVISSRSERSCPALAGRIDWTGEHRMLQPRLAT